MSLSMLVSPFPFTSGQSIANIPRETWLEARQQGVGASEAAAVCGIRPSPLEIFLRKTGQLPPIEDNEAMRIGRLSEPMLATLYQDRTGHLIQTDQAFCYQDDNPRVFATIDAIRDDNRPVEFKVVGLRTARDWGDEDDGLDGVPGYFVAQLCHQMLATGSDRIDIMALIGTETRLFEIERDERFDAPMAFLKERLAWFLDHLDRNEPPPAVHDGDERMMHLVHPGCSGEIELTGIAGDAGMAFLDLGADIKHLENERADAKRVVLDAMANASLAILPDGRRISRNIVSTPDRFDVFSPIVKGLHYVGLREKKGRS